MLRNNCRGPWVVGALPPSENMPPRVYGWQCTNDEYIGDMWVAASRREEDALDGFRIYYMCCQNNLWP